MQLFEQYVQVLHIILDYIVIIFFSYEIVLVWLTSTTAVTEQKPSTINGYENAMEKHIVQFVKVILHLITFRGTQNPKIICVNY